jgi:cystathionine beta-lyase
VGYTPPRAGYLAWLDLRALNLGEDPSEALLERGKVALSPGPSFGPQGAGFARLNFGTSPALLEEAVARIARAVGRE